jgi:hypothetical protein
MVDGWVVGRFKIEVFRFIQEKQSMVDEEKRVMMCHAMKSSFVMHIECHVIFYVSCHINIHVSCHINIVSMSTKKWSMADGRVDRIGEVFSSVYRNGQWMNGWVSRIGKVFHLTKGKSPTSQWSGWSVS